MRLIDADALLENYDLKNAVKYGNKSAEQRDKSYSTLMMYEIADMIDDAPTIESPRGWTPCAEGLPESGKHVLLTCEMRPSGTKYVCDGFYVKKLSMPTGYDCDLDCDYDEEKDEYFLPEGFYEIVKNWEDYSSILIEDFPIAWQPLPEPYNPDRKEDAKADDVSKWPEWKQRAALSNYKFENPNHIVDANKKVDQVCPVCNSMAHYDPHFGRVMCRQCGWMQEDTK